VGEHRQPTSIREWLEPMLVAFLAGLALGRVWGLGVLDPLAIVLALAAIVVLVVSTVRTQRGRAA
jgi:hypothetical protein